MKQHTELERSDVAITGGTGFVGGHLARALAADGRRVSLIARGADRRSPELRTLTGARFFPMGLDDVGELARAFEGCRAVAHCAGINREVGRQTYERVHVQGTRNVVAAARRAGVSRIVLLSFLRARPGCGSRYHESKWAAEEILRSSGIDYTILRPGVIYGRGDHMLDHMSRALRTLPVFGLVGMKSRRLRPLAVKDLAEILVQVLIDGRLRDETVAVTGPEELTLKTAVQRIAEVLGRRPLFVRLPVAAHYMLAAVLERLMTIPLTSLAQVRILSEELVAASPGARPLPPDMQPRTRFDDAQIRAGLPDEQRFGVRDCRCLAEILGR